MANFCEHDTPEGTACPKCAAKASKSGKGMGSIPVLPNDNTPRSDVGKAYGKSIDEMLAVEKFNPNHDEMGRFALAIGRERATLIEAGRTTTGSTTPRHIARRSAEMAMTRASDFHSQSQHGKAAHHLSIAVAALTDGGYAHRAKKVAAIHKDYRSTYGV